MKIIHQTFGSKQPAPPPPAPPPAQGPEQRFSAGAATEVLKPATPDCVVRGTELSPQTATLKHGNSPIPQ